MSKVKYDNHIAEYSESLKNEETKLHYETWFDKSTLDYWHHSRLRDFLKIIIKHNTDASWLTVGDGRFGTDAHSLFVYGAKDVHASDISDELLIIGKQRKFITSFSSQNAEDLSFEDNSFDYVYCKESVHHFPRPYIALKEMFRVCRKGVIITEPRDQILDRSFMHSWIKLLKTILKKNTTDHAFEEVGNYIYSFSERELEKFLLGMHYTNISFLGINDVYMDGMEYIPYKPKSFSEKVFTLKFKIKLFFLDAISFLELRKTGVLSSILFKEEPEKDLLISLKNYGFKNKNLPKNPFIDL